MNVKTNIEESYGKRKLVARRDAVTGAFVDYKVYSEKNRILLTTKDYTTAHRVLLDAPQPEVTPLLPEIKILIDEGGIFQGIYVSPELKDADVELIDFVTDDPDELEDAETRHCEAVSRTSVGELVFIAH